MTQANTRHEFTDARQFLGAAVTVTIDRPLGSRHPRHRDVYYPANYGLVPGALSPDSSALDVYPLGVFTPVAAFTGKCIAVIH